MNDRLILILFQILTVAVAAGLVWIIYRLLRHRSGADPVQILKARYARGEIDRDTYERTLRDLRGSDANQ